jgi:hypothetical protein
VAGAKEGPEEMVTAWDHGETAQAVAAKEPITTLPTTECCIISSNFNPASIRLKARNPTRARILIGQKKRVKTTRISSYALMSKAAWRVA